jgi:hypothetical protein
MIQRFKLLQKSRMVRSAIVAAPLLTAAFLMVFTLPAERAAVTDLAGVECMEEPNSAADAP